MKRVFLFAVFLFLNFYSLGLSQENIAPAEVVEIVNFSGTIEIIYSDGTRFIIKTGDEILPLMSGTVIRILEGTLSLRVGEVVNHYGVGELVRISETATGNWEAFVSPSKVAPEVGISNVVNPEETQEETGSDFGEFVSPSSPSNPS